MRCAGPTRLDPALQWYGLVAPACTPREIVVNLHGAVVRVLQDRDAGLKPE
jgi:hypothetical protein